MKSVLTSPVTVILVVTAFFFGFYALLGQDLADSLAYAVLSLLGLAEIVFLISLPFIDLDSAEPPRDQS